MRATRMDSAPGHGRPFRSWGEIRTAAERCEVVSVGCFIVRRDDQAMNYTRRVRTAQTLHGCVKRQMGEIVRIEGELAKTLAQFGDADPLATRLREQLRRAESQLSLAEAALEKAMGEL